MFYYTELSELLVFFRVVEAALLILGYMDILSPQNPGAREETPGLFIVQTP